MFNRIFIVLLMVLSVGCLSDKSAKPSTLVFCSEGSPRFFNPQLAIDAATYNASSKTVYNRLVDFDLGSTEIKPSLAKSWKISSDGLEYKFFLREDIEFHSAGNFTPTRKFNAQDVIFTFERMKNVDHPFHKVSGDSYEYFQSMGLSTLIESITAENENTVVFKLSKPNAPFITGLAMDFASILSEEYGQALLGKGTPEKMDQIPVGTGPFIFKKYVKDTMIEYETNKNYKLSEIPNFKKLVFAITPSADARFEKLKNKECHIVNEPNPSDLERIGQLGYATVVRRSGMNTGYLAMNTNKEPFNNLLVRKALNHAMNKRRYIEKVFLGLAIEALGVLPPMVWGHISKLPKYKYDPALARDLLAQAGYGKGFSANLWYLPVGRPYNPNGKLLADMMKADLAAVGIKVELITYDWGEYLERTRQGEHDMAMLGWTGDNADPDNFMAQLLSCDAVAGGANIARWCHQEFNDLVTKAKTATRSGIRANYYKRAQQIFARQVPWVPLVHTEVFRVHLNSVKNYVLNPMGTENFHKIRLQQ